MQLLKRYKTFALYCKVKNVSNIFNIRNITSHYAQAKFVSETITFVFAYYSVIILPF